jgi:hypothetical protein
VEQFSAIISDIMEYHPLAPRLGKGGISNYSIEVVPGELGHCIGRES